MRHKLRFVSVLIGSALVGGLAMTSATSAGLSQELSVESPTAGTRGELNRQSTTSGELPAASGFQELNAADEPPLPYIQPAPKKPVVAAKPAVEPVKVEPEPKVKWRPAKKVKKPKKTAKKVVQPKAAPTPSSSEGKIRLIPIEEIPIVGVEVVSETAEPTAPQSAGKRKTDQIDRN